MSDPIHIPLPETIRLRFQQLAEQKRQIDRDMKTIADTVLGTLYAPTDPVWGGTVHLAAAELVVTFPESAPNG